MHTSYKHPIIFGNSSEFFSCNNTVKDVMCSEFYFSPNFTWVAFNPLGTCSLCRNHARTTNAHLDLVSSLETKFSQVGRTSIYLQRNNKYVSYSLNLSNVNIDGFDNNCKTWLSSSYIYMRLTIFGLYASAKTYFGRNLDIIIRMEIQNT